MATLSAELNALPLEQLIGSLTSSLVKAQGLASDETARFIDQIGFEDGPNDQPPALRTFDFQFTRAEVDDTTGEVVQRQVTVTLPLLSIVNVPSIGIDEATMDFDVRIVAHGNPESQAPTTGRSVAAASPRSLGPQIRRLYTVPARKTVVVDNQPTDSRASLRVRVRMRQMQQPLGIEKLLNLVDTSFAERIETPATDAQTTDTSTEDNQ